MLRIHSASAVANSDIANVSQPKKELTMKGFAIDSLGESSIRNAENNVVVCT
jgi:hypothetical protein